jgi:molybdopterin-guanine dinucleotide biosynthesis protein A
MVLILAGGDGRRIGGGKPLRMLGGRSLIDRAVERAQAWSGDVRLSLRSPDQIGCAPLPVVVDDSAIEGPLGGIAAGLRAAGEAGRGLVLTLPCDMPFAPGDLRDRLQGSIGGAGAALAASEGQLHPVCALWRVEALDALNAYVRSRRRSLVGFAAAAGFVSVEWVGDPFFNVNDEAGLAEAARRLRS